MADSSFKLDSGAPLAKRLWKLLFALGLIVITIAIANCFLPADKAISRGQFGHDFLAFYSAGKLVRDDNAAALYDLDLLAAEQRQIASKARLELTAPIAPYWNPPHVALLFSALSELSFNSALLLWTVFGVFCLTTSALLLIAIVRDSTALRSEWLLVPAAMLVAPPLIQALGHGQNTPLSLLLLTLTVLAWRAHEPIWAGLCCALLFYKPQLAAVMFVALSLTLGWRVWVGTFVGGLPQLLLTVTRLPGSLGDYFEHMGRNLHAIQFDQPYLWHRHVTLNGFFRFTFQGNGAGETHWWLTVASSLAALAIVSAIGWVWWRSRSELNNAAVLDRFISLTILSMPLLMPFYFDYDLLLLIIPAVLIANERLVNRDSSPATSWLTVAGCVLYAWTMFNPPVAEVTGVSLTVPLLASVVALQAKRCVTPLSQSALPINIARSPERLAA